MRDLSGLVFGSLTVLGYATKRGRSDYWTVKCECGEITLKTSANLPKAKGCSYVCPITRGLHRNAISTHGMKKHRAYRIWAGMNVRCTNPKSKDWPRYGGRGIFVCDAWRESFGSFWADMKDTYAPNLTLDRIDNNGPYEATNCRWVTAKDNARNRRNSIVTKEQREIADSNGITKATLGYRIRSGWPVEQAISVKADRTNRSSCL